MTSLIRKSLVSTTCVIATLALAGNALAATTHVKAKTVAHPSYRSTRDVAAIPPYPYYSPEASPAARSRAAYAARPSYPYGYPYRVARYPFAAGGIDVGQVVGAMLGMVPPQYAGIVQTAMRQAASHRSSGGSSGTYDPSFDSPTASTPIDNSASDAAAASAAAAMAGEDADLQSLDASIAASEAQNDAANAATQEYLTNNGM